MVSRQKRRSRSAVAGKDGSVLSLLSAADDVDVDIAVVVVAVDIAVVVSAAAAVVVVAVVVVAGSASFDLRFI